MSERKWKPCPFCGGRARKVAVDEPSNVGGYIVMCLGCQCSTAVVFPDKCSPDDHLDVLWNRRSGEALGAGVSTD